LLISGSLKSRKPDMASWERPGGILTIRRAATRWFRRSFRSRMVLHVPPRRAFRSITGGTHYHGSLGRLLIFFSNSISRNCLFSSMAEEHRRSIGIDDVLPLSRPKATKNGPIASHKVSG